jgi:energy-coupling factor transport system ATP-binding protein
MVIIEFKNFFYRYKGNNEYALNNVNLNIKENKFILLCGETGSGKTTLIKCMNGLIPQFYSGFYRGYVKVMGKDTTKVPVADLATEVGIVFQNPENQLVTMNIEHEIVFGLENLGVVREDIKKKLDNVVKITEIESILDKAPFELSGGEQQRVAIASILVLEPKVIILDEPTALLDPYMAEKIIELLKEIQTKKNLTVIISEHRMDLVLPFADEVILIKEGKVIEHDSREKVINGNNFQSLKLNKPVIYSIFNHLKNNKLFNQTIPVSIPEAVRTLKSLGMK